MRSVVPIQPVKVYDLAKQQRVSWFLTCTFLIHGACSLQAFAVLSWTLSWQMSLAPYTGTSLYHSVTRVLTIQCFLGQPAVFLYSNGRILTVFLDHSDVCCFFFNFLSFWYLVAPTPNVLSTNLNYGILNTTAFLTLEENEEVN